MPVSSLHNVNNTGSMYSVSCADTYTLTLGSLSPSPFSKISKDYYEIFLSPTHISWVPCTSPCDSLQVAQVSDPVEWIKTLYLQKGSFQEVPFLESLLFPTPPNIQDIRKSPSVSLCQCGERSDETCLWSNGWQLINTLIKKTKATKF